MPSSIQSPQEKGDCVASMSSRYNLDWFVEKLRPQVRGTIAVRDWLERDGKLYSWGVGDSIWTNPMQADLVPSKDNDHGLYARVPNKHHAGTKIVGLVEFRGKILEHSDGILRGEWAKILCVFCHNEYDYNVISESYPDIHVYHGILERLGEEIPY